MTDSGITNQIANQCKSNESYPLQIKLSGPWFNNYRSVSLWENI